MGVAQGFPLDCKFSVEFGERHEIRGKYISSGCGFCPDDELRGNEYKTDIFTGGKSVRGDELIQSRKLRIEILGCIQFAVLLPEPLGVIIIKICHYLCLS